MAYFRVEIMDKDGKTIELQYLELSVNTSEEALHITKIIDLKNEAKRHGYAFRVKKED